MRWPSTQPSSHRIWPTPARSAGRPTVRRCWPTRSAACTRCRSWWPVKYVGALDVFHAEPATLSAEQLIGMVAAAALAQIPMLDLLDQNFDDAATPGSDAWTELNALTRAEVAQATGMLMAQLGVQAPTALVRLRAHAYATGRSATDVARDIIERRLRLEPD